MHCFMGHSVVCYQSTYTYYSCWADDARVIIMLLLLRVMAICLFYKLSESHDHRRDTNLTMDDVSAVHRMLEYYYESREQ